MHQVKITGFLPGKQIDWSILALHSEAAQKIIARFSEWSINEMSAQSLSAVRDAFPDLWAEVCDVGRVVNSDPMAVLAANCFYDLSLRRYGCTAFVVDVPGGPIHAHCLDWDLGAELLREHVSLYTFIDQAYSPCFYSIGWPGFLGVLVGVAPGRFAVSLNAVWSEDAMIEGEPVAFLLRRILATVDNYEQAVIELRDARIGCDCLFVISGVDREQLAVIERTPVRSTVRRSSCGTVLATNHYCALKAGTNRPDYTPTGTEPVGHGSIDRYSAVVDCLSVKRPRSVESCYSLLNSPPFRQPITVQRVVMRAATGEILASPSVSSLTVHRIV